MIKTANFRDLHIWMLGKNIVLDTYAISKHFPREEVYGLTSQMRRSAVSIPSNIAEGFNRSRIKDYRRFLYIALGSCAELETQTEIAFELGYLDNHDKNMILEKLDHESRMINNLVKKLDLSIN